MKNAPGKVIFIFLYLAICLTTINAMARRSGQVQQADPENAFSWRLALMNLYDANSLDHSATVMARQSDEFKLAIESTVQCYLYVVAIVRPGNDVNVIYSGSLPQDRNWLSPVIRFTGLRANETKELYIIVSRNEQAALSREISALGETLDVSQRRNVQTAIANIDAGTSGRREAPERPSLIAGVVRYQARGPEGEDQDLIPGIEYSGLETYVKKIDIRIRN
jgi:hypothetical protein